MIDFNDYSDFICSKMLRLSKGESLSVNTEECDFELAKAIANKAVEITQVSSRIVTTECGKPSDVIEFDPDKPVVKTTSVAMVRVKHIAPVREYDASSLSVVIDKNDMKAVQKLGHLADPVLLDRRVSVPWCIVPSYDSNDNRWDSVLSDIETFDRLCEVSTLRKRFLTHADVNKVVVTGKNTAFEFTVDDCTNFISSITNLRSGRSFVSSLNPDLISFTLNKNSVNGYLLSSSVVLGRPMDLDLCFRNGVATVKNENREISQFLSFDEDSCKAGYFSAKDHCFSLFLGGSIVDSIPDECFKNETLPEGFNRSLYSLELKLDDRLSITFTDCDGNTKELVRKGCFLE